MENDKALLKAGALWEKGKVRALIFIAFLGVTLLIFLISVAKGSVEIPLPDVVRVILGQTVENDNFRPIVINMRLPRALATLIGGACLGLSGLYLQIFFRNPIVEPYVLGISSGATFVVGLVVLGGVTFGLKTLPPMFLFFGAFIGAIVVMLVVLYATKRVKSITTLLIVGIMTGFLCSAATSLMTAFADKEQVHGFAMWALGSFSGFTWVQVRILCIIALPLILVSFFLSKPLNAMLFGEKYAATMGLNVKRFQMLLIFFASVMTAVVTAFAGPISFVGLAIPHIMRVVFKTTENKILVPAVIIGGALMTSGCDMVARLLLAPIELPLGAITAFIGAPLVMYLMTKKGGEI